MRANENILSYLSAEPARCLSGLGSAVFDRLAEVRLRADKPLLIRVNGAEYGVTGQGQLVGQAQAADIYITTRADIAETLERISRHSLYAYEEELRMGYITLPGGHRAGVAGRAALEGQSVKMIQMVSSINFRIAHEVKGCGDGVLPYLLAGGARPLCHTMIISPPGGGKTTLLRDIARQVSGGVPGLCAGMTVGVVDERSEIAGCCNGIAQNDVGPRTDVLDGCPKAEGMMLLLRSMAPDVIAVDELGGERDARAVEDVLSAGVKLLCTAHGYDWADIKRKPTLKALTDKPIFERFVVLETPGKVTGVYDGGGTRLA